MPSWFTAGPFSGRDGEGRALFADVTLELGDGELVLLDGPSGSGKSTLLRQLVGMAPADGATRMLAGEQYSSHQLPVWRARVTLVAQDAPMLRGTVGDNLRFPFALRCGASAEPDDDRLEDLLRSTRLGGIPMARDVATLSGGERHRLALVRGLWWDPPVLVADEPLSGLDETMAEQCFELLLEAARRPGHAVLGVLHDRSLAGLADRRVALRRSHDGGTG